MPRIDDGETAQEMAKRLCRRYEDHIDMLWDDYVGELAGIYGLSDEAAQQLLEDNE